MAVSCASWAPIAAPWGSDSRCRANQVRVSRTSRALAAALGVVRSWPDLARLSRYLVSAVSTGARRPLLSRSASSGSSRAERSIMSAAWLVCSSRVNSSRMIDSSSAAGSGASARTSASASEPNGTSAATNSRASAIISASGGAFRGKAPLGSSCAGSGSRSSACLIARTNRSSLPST